MINPETLAREKILFAYTQALEAGDFATLQKILEQASADPLLEKQILEINAVLSQPKAESAPPVVENISSSNLLQWLKSSLSILTSSQLWKGSKMGSAVAVLAVFLVLLVIGRALLGPAIGNTFTNINAYTPFSGRLTDGQREELVQATAQALYATQDSLQLSTPTPYVEHRSDAYAAYPTPASQPFTPEPGQPQLSAAGQQPPSTERLIVRNASLNLVVKDTRQARLAVVAMMADYSSEGAYIVSVFESYPTAGQMPAILMTLRVPVKRYDESMTRLEGLSIQVLDRQENAQDVTSAYVDVSGRVRALETSRDRLLEIVKEAKNTDDLLRAEAELSRRESELEAAQATQKYLEQTAALSSITLQMGPPPISQPVTDNTWNPLVTFRNAVRTLLANLRTLADGLIYFTVATLPWLAVFGLIIYGALRLFRKRQP